LKQFVATEFAMAMKTTTTVRKIATLLVSVMMDTFLIALMTIAVQSHGLVMATVMMKLSSGAVT